MPHGLNFTEPHPPPPLLAAATSVLAFFLRCRGSIFTKHRRRLDANKGNCVMAGKGPSEGSFPPPHGPAPQVLGRGGQSAWGALSCLLPEEADSYRAGLMEGATHQPGVSVPTAGAQTVPFHPIAGAL